MAESLFGERFRFARIEQAHRGETENDSAFARAVGVVPGAVTGYRKGDKPPPVARIRAIAARCGVDPGWLAFGEDSQAPSPDGFMAWLANQPGRKSKLRPDPRKKAAGGATKRA